MIADDLIAEHNRIDDWVKKESKRFEEYCKPHKERLREIEQQLHDYMLEQKVQNVKGQSGTAYLSRILTLKVENRENLLDFAVEHWDEIGNALLLISAQKEAVRQYMDEHDGTPPPGVSTDYFIKCNVRST